MNAADINESDADDPTPSAVMVATADGVAEFARSFIELIPAVVEEQVGFRVRIRFKQEKAVVADEPTQSFCVDGWTIVLAGGNPDEPLNSQDLTINVRGFPTHDKAASFADNLRTALIVKSATRRTGIDLGDNRPTAWMAEAIKEIIKNETGVTVRDDIHGIEVFYEDGPTVYHRTSATATVSMRATDFVPEIDGSLAWVEHVTPTMIDACRLLNVADLSAPPVVRLSLSSAAIEALSPPVPWSPEAKASLDQVTSLIEGDMAIDEQERERLAGSIRSVRDFGLSGGRRVRAHLENVGQRALTADLAQAAKVRGKLLHGKYVGKEEIQSAAEAYRTAAQIILEITLTNVGISPQSLRGIA